MGPQAGSRILIVDDVEDNRVILRRSLRNFDCTVAEAADGMTALQMIGLEAYDLVLLDVMMPGLDGFEVLARLRLRYTRDELPVIMVTARTTSQDILQAFESGANDYLTKPVERKVALARIAVQLESLHARRALQHSLHQMESLNRTLEQEIIARKVQEERADHMAFHDPLTGLANWMLLRDRIGFALRRSEHHSILSALVLLDLLEFRAVNETHGHAAGDAILSAAAGRLTNASREGDVVARIGSNRFAVLLNGLRNPADAEMLAANLRNAITGEYALPDAQIAVQANAGVALAPTDGATSDLLLENANLALNQARGDAPGALCFFEADMNTRSRERRRLQNDLEKALLGNQFELYFQPFYNLDRDAVTGCEALLRWKHPTRGMVSPLDFIPLAEKTGFIVPLGEWALYKACNFAAQWPNDRKIAVNISPVQFRESNFVEIVEAALRTSGLPPHRLELEITESLLLDDDNGTLDKMRQIRDLGVRISLDDFGTGYSSLSYIHRFPFSKLKIDQSFVRNIGESASCEPILSAIVNLSLTLAVDTIAEGIETAEQMACLKRLGCGEIQGYLISRPVPAAELEALIDGDARKRVA